MMSFWFWLGVKPQTAAELAMNVSRKKSLSGFRGKLRKDADKEHSLECTWLVFLPFVLHNSYYTLIPTDQSSFTTKERYYAGISINFSLKIEIYFTTFVPTFGANWKLNFCQLPPPLPPPSCRALQVCAASCRPAGSLQFHICIKFPASIPIDCIGDKSLSLHNFILITTYIKWMSLFYHLPMISQLCGLLSSSSPNLVTSPWPYNSM